jgi:LSD1 subclass zinc finger protein
MPILLLLLGLGVFVYLWWVRRDSRLTRACRWRLDRGAGAHRFRCAACGAVTTTAEGGLPRDCLRGTLPPA